jgi:GT2 family glycosyltransferase
VDEPPSNQLQVVLVNYRSIGAIRNLFESGALAGCAVTVVDNGDEPDGTTALCREFGAEPLLLPENVGFAAGVNRAVAAIGETRGPWLLLNPDVTVTAEQLTALREELRATGADGVAPLLRLPSGALQVGVAGGPVSLRSTIYYFWFIAHFFPQRRGIFLTRRQSMVGPQRVDWLCMACLMLMPDAFSRFGPIPEDELVYAEDVAWGTLATCRGAVFRLVPSVVVGHQSGASGGSQAWQGALGRLCRRRLGRVRGAIAAGAIRTGVRLRRVAGAVR